MVQCTKCGQTKDQSQFSKSSSAKNGLQPRCKECNVKDNLKFRTEINPIHHSDWQKNNKQRTSELIKRFRKADKSGKIYSIQNPNGDCYIGITKTPISVRLGEHRKCYRKDNGRIPLLHKSFDKYGYDNHKIEVVVELEDIDRKQLQFIESSFIQSFKEIGKSLNIRTK
jgi:adenine-specific DNA glycosylase